MPFEFGDIVLVRFPFTNQAVFKQRPAVIVSSREYNLAKQDVVIAAVTSQVHTTPAFGECRISQWQAAHLLKPSAIKPVFATVEQALILKSLGALEAADVAALRELLALVLS